MCSREGRLNRMPLTPVSVSLLVGSCCLHLVQEIEQL